MRALIAALLLAAAPAAAAPVDLDAARWAELGGASAAIFAVAEVSDEARFATPDRWEVADAAGGDCEDKALLARAQLLAKGWPPQALRLALAWTEAGAYHAVLTIDVVRAGRPATYVIDPRFPFVVGWDQLTRHGYRWDRRQAADAHGWVRIATAREVGR